MNLPFTNIRQVLSLHNKVSPEKIFLTVSTDKGREELSYGEFSARCHQTANFLQEDLGIKPGNVVNISDDEPATTAVLLMACWLVGAAIAPVMSGRDIIINNVPAKASFVRHRGKQVFNSFAPNREWKDKFLVQLGGEPTEGYPHFDTLVRSMPNSFFNDHEEPTLNTPVFFSYNFKDNVFIPVTQGELLDSAQTLATKQVITGNQRVISYLELLGNPDPESVLNTLSVFISTLLVGASLILVKLSRPRDVFYYGPYMEPNAFWREVAASRLHIACITFYQIKQLIDFAYKQRTDGKPIYGEGIYQQDIQQLRHIYCPDAKGQDDLIKQFTDMFPFPIVTSS